VTDGLSHSGNSSELEDLQGRSPTTSRFKCVFHRVMHQLTRFQLTRGPSVTAKILEMTFLWPPYV